jgi:hypothetical protein
MPSTRKIEWADALRSGQIRVTGPRARQDAADLEPPGVYTMD